MMLHLVVVARGPDSLRLGYGRPGRIVLAGIGVFLFTGMAVTGEFPAVLFALAMVSLGAGVYEERWEFDRKTRTATRIRGFGPMSSRFELAFDRLSAVLVRAVASPVPNGESRGKGGDPVIPDALRKGRAVLLIEYLPEPRAAAGDPQRPSPTDRGNGAGGRPARLVVEDGTHRDRDKLEAMGSAIASFCGIGLDTGSGQV